MNSHNKEQSTSIRKLSADEITTVNGGVAGMGTGISSSSTGTGIYSSSSGTGGTFAVDGGTGRTDDNGSGTGL